MKNFTKQSVTILLLAVFSFTAKSQTNVSGFIPANTTWTVIGSPYIITGNALLMQGDTLIIEPGVTVKFDTGTTLQFDGDLIAIGTASNRITFTSNQGTPHAGDWAELHFSDHASDAVFDTVGNYQSGCILKYCDVLYGGNSNFGLIHIESSSPYISQCTVQHSNSSGIYCNNDTNLPDSSTVNDCHNYGIYFTGCGAKLLNDSIKNNLGGGLYIGTGCAISIKNNYFYNNSSHGAIYAPNDDYASIFVSDNYFDNNRYDNYFTNDIAIITLKCDSIEFGRNHFINNSFSGITAGSLISFKPVLFGSDSISTLRVTNNYLSNNTAINGTFIMLATYFHSGVIRENSFIHNSVGDYTSATLGNYSCTFDTIECNLFQNNQSGNNAYGALAVQMGGTQFISKNIFEGNHNYTANPVSVAHIDCTSGGTNTCSFVNNTIRNNSSSSGPCIEFLPNIINQEVLQVHDNNFVNNIANAAIKLTGNNIGTINRDFIYFKRNNFSDPNATYELYNNIPYGSPNVYADSNYWNGTSNQHLDSAVYDYFDNGNLSVVYYQPILSAPVNIDTTCASFPTAVIEAKSLDEGVSIPFPNPFSTYTEIAFGNELNDASLLLYNVFGQNVLEMNAISGTHIFLRREGLPSGIYIYDVMEKGRRIGNGKLMVE